MIELPIDPVAPSVIDPRVLVIYSLPKVGKTPCLAQLPNCLILDLEGGTDFIAARKLRIIGLTHKRAKDGGPETPEEVAYRHSKVDLNGKPKQPEYYLSEAITALRQPHTFKYGAIDTITMLEQWCEEDATYMYMNSPIGKNFNKYTDKDYQESGGKYMPGTYKPRSQWESVLSLPKGAGYQYLRESYLKWINYLRPLFPTLILSGHVKLTTMVNKIGKEVEGKDLDLTGKIKSLTTGLIADAIGYMHREGKRNLISFIPSDEVVCGNRSPHLEGQDILISEKMEDKTIQVYWKNIFQELGK